MESYSSTKTQSWLIWFLRGVLILSFLFLITRLIDLQVIKGAYYRQLSEGNRIRRVPIVAPRGKIYARNGELLADNIEVRKRVVFDPASGFTKEVVGLHDSGDDIIVEWRRHYPPGSVAAHIVGYLGEVGPDELGRVDAACIERGPRSLGELVGRMGLERQYQCSLSGVNGEELVEVDSFGNKVRTLGIKNATPGDDLTVSLDLSLQRKIAELMEGKTGAVIVTDSRGEVFSLYSSPSFNLNVFATSDTKSINAIMNSPDQVLYNRAIGGRFPPGSVFKPLVAIASLEENIVDKNYTYFDRGFIEIKTLYGDFSYRNWYYIQYGGTEGEVDLARAIARSTDTLFYEVGGMMGVDKIAEWSRKFGLDKQSGIDIPGEVAGIVPDREWKEIHKNEQWFLGNTYHYSIGQGDLAITPLALNMMTQAVATGKLCTPRFGFDAECRDLGIKKENLDYVHEGMRQACAFGGTGFTFFEINAAADDGAEILIVQGEGASELRKEIGVHTVSCKTGTAETGDGKLPHSWFTFFAPMENPEIVVTVLVENGGEGSQVAGPIAREIYNHWFSK